MTLTQRINRSASRLPTWPLYIVGVLPPVWFLWLGLTGGLGVEPIKALEHRLGELALQMFIASLAVTPLRTWPGVHLTRFPRALALLTFVGEAGQTPGHFAGASGVAVKGDRFAVVDQLGGRLQLFRFVVPKTAE